MSFVPLKTVTLLCMSVRHLDQEKSKPSGSLSRPTPTRVAQIRRGYTLFGKAAVLYMAVKLQSRWTA